MNTILQRSRHLLPLIIAMALAVSVITPVAAAGQSNLAALRNATARFHDIDKAEAAGYTIKVADLAGIECIAQPGVGVMGIHFLNLGLLDDAVNATTPELLIYEPGRGNSLKLIAVEYLVIQSAWEEAGNTSPPSLFGEEFNLTPAGNRYGLPAFYELHVWVWKPNPNGMFYEWNPNVSC